LIGQVTGRSGDEDGPATAVHFDGMCHPRSSTNHHDGKALSVSVDSSFHSQSDEEDSSGNSSLETESEFEIMVAEVRRQVVMHNDSAVSIG
jgi:hypothetical protein